MLRKNTTLENHIRISSLQDLNFTANSLYSGICDMEECACCIFTGALAPSKSIFLGLFSEVHKYIVLLLFIVPSQPIFLISDDRLMLS